ncbi:EAL domain-containing protein [Rhodoferax sp.]|uniref:putative bifunctional diguanylate cyclase/phosphodiesterase n=1 Tax=Rhodoferax sp. TaxID=50421 RepID=UPI001EC13720|nr:EAL domain-containing protein [Rhodoferax sp.]MBT9505594.1 EAL domain-containing protein [Rhodoferax sp.]
MHQTSKRAALSNPDTGFPPRLSQAFTHNTALSALEEAASFGRWWFDCETSQMVLSALAASYLNVETLCHDRLDGCFISVVLDDLLPLISQLSSKPLQSGGFEFRVISPLDGLRWLRMTHMPADPDNPGLLSGILVDITPIKHAMMRERLGFELTEFLVGSHSLGDAITNVIQLICRNLGWDWGAYWAMEQSPQGASRLVCKHFWHRPELDLGSLGMESVTSSLAPGEGLVGSVWESGQPDWVEDMANDLRFSQRTNDRECRLWSGYVFPVTYVSADGHQHNPGVLEFYSCLSRQPEAQLPKLSATIGALIAQMAKRLDQQATILYLAQVDGLTGLVNRSHFYELLTQACTASEKANTSFGLVFIDLDRFKPINDAFGHEAGNVVLHEFARRLRALAPAGASVGRLGGDEFALLLPGQSQEDIATLVEQVLQAARLPFAYEGVELTVSASVGVSTFPQGGKTCPALLQSADAAMYRIKNNGRNGCHFFSLSSPNALALHRSSIAQRLALETELHHALQGDELFLAYQPIFNIRNQTLEAVEALVRWKRPDGTLVPPDVFIPIAEQSHLIVQLGKWVVSQACRDLAILRAANFQTLKIHVNMAASEFTSSTLPDELCAQVAAYDLDPSSLTLELTEGMLMKSPDQVIPVMRALRRLGFGISLDDFGMGHSSLALLKNLPISSLKIDRSFVSDLTQQRNDRAIVKTIIDLGCQMDLEVIAEGVEAAPQLAILQQSGCILIQGYLIDRPLAIAELLAKYPAERQPHELHAN